MPLRDETARNSSRFKNPFRHDDTTEKEEPAKPLTNKEADELLQKTKDALKKAFLLPDVILEIIVKGHEEVDIWSLDDEDAESWAKLLIEQGKRNGKEAQVVRKLASAYDRLFLAGLFIPRIKQTFTHIKGHGGIGFR